MHSVLLVIEKPNTEVALNNQSWLGILGDVENHINNIENNPNNDCTKKLAEGVLLIDLKTSLPLFATLISKAQTSGFSYQVLFFEKEPQWIRHVPQ